MTNSTIDTACTDDKITLLSPDSFLNSHGSLLLEKGYPIIPIRSGLKDPRKEGWQKLQATVETLVDWQKSEFGPGSGVGVLTKTCPAIDLDIYDADVVQLLVEYCTNTIGSVPCRIGQPPKALLPYRTDTPFKKMARTYKDEDGKKHKVEILGDGQQFVAYHIHPDTKRPYSYQDGPELVDVAYNDLPELVRDQALNVLDKFCELAEEKGWQQVSGYTALAATNEANDTPVTTLEQLKIKSALSCIDPNLEYDYWLNVGFALHDGSHGETWGFDLWVEHFKVGREGDIDEWRDKWDGSFCSDGRETADTITLGTLFHYAQEAGWDNDQLARDLVEWMQEWTVDEIDEQIDAVSWLEKSYPLKFEAVKISWARKNIVGKQVLNRQLKRFREASREENEGETHHSYASQIINSFDCPSIYTEGQFYQCPDGVWNPITIETLQLDVVEQFDGQPKCERKSDYKAIATHIQDLLYSPEFFYCPPVGFSADKMFYRLGIDGEWQEEELKPEHKQRYNLPTRPCKGDMPLFEKYLAEAFLGSEDQILVAQEVAGAVLTGQTALMQKVIFLYGPGQTGKSTILKVFENLVPETYRSASSPFNWDREYYLANLAGKKINVVGELEENTPIPAGAFKKVTGDDLLEARHPTHRPFTFRNTAAHIFNSNYLVTTRDTSAAFFRRWQILAFNNPVKDENKVDGLADRIILGEFTSILVWAMEGASRLQKQGKFTETDQHEKLMLRWRSRANSVAEFLLDEEHVQLAKHTGENYAPVRRSTVQDEYKIWCMENNLRPVSRQKFTDRLREVSHITGCTVHKVEGIWEVRGLKLNAIEGNVLSGH